MTAVLALTGGSVEVARQGSSRVVAAADFFLGPLESACAAGRARASRRSSLRCRPRTGSTFVEVARRHGDYAVCGVAAAVTLDDAGAVTVGPRGLRLRRADAARARPDRGGRGAAAADADWAAAGELRAVADRAGGRHPRDGRLSPPPRRCADRARARRGCRAGSMSSAAAPTRCTTYGCTSTVLPHAGRACPRAGCCRTSCATTCGSPARTSGASTASAAPARCCSTVRRSAPACCSP